MRKLNFFKFALTIGLTTFFLSVYHSMLPSIFLFALGSFVIITVASIIFLLIAYASKNKPLSLREDSIYSYVGKVVLGDGTNSDDLLYLYEMIGNEPIESFPEIYKVKRIRENSRINNGDFMIVGHLYKPKSIQSGYINSNPSFSLSLEPYVEPIEPDSNDELYDTKEVVSDNNYKFSKYREVYEDGNGNKIVLPGRLRIVD